MDLDALHALQRVTPPVEEWRNKAAIPAYRGTPYGTALVGNGITPGNALPLYNNLHTKEEVLALVDRAIAEAA